MWIKGGMLAKGIWKQDPKAKKDENAEWRRLHNDEFHSLYRTPNIFKVIKFRRLKWTGHVARMEENRIAFKTLTGKPAGKRQLGRPRRRWEDNIKNGP